MLKRTTEVKETKPVIICPDENEGLNVATVSIEGTGLNIPMMRCYNCKVFMRKGRVISRKTGLAICSGCDDTKEEKAEVVSKLRRGSSIEELPIEECICWYCEKPIIDEKAIQKRLERRTASGSLSDRDVRRIEQKLRTDGWRKLGGGKYAHNRCNSENS